MAELTTDIGATGFTVGAVVKNPPAKCRRCKGRGFDPWVGKIRWSRKWQTTPVLLPEKSHRQSSLASYSPGRCREQLCTIGYHKLAI